MLSWGENIDANVQRRFSTGELHPRNEKQVCFLWGRGQLDEQNTHSDNKMQLFGCKWMSHKVETSQIGQVPTFIVAWCALTLKAMDKTMQNKIN